MTCLEKNTYHFSKMHGLGNDFVLINAMQQPFLASEADIARLACRRTGIGFDQLLLLTPPPQGTDAQFGYRIFNADGSQAGQCGNGARCLARFIARAGLNTTPTLTVAMQTGRSMHLQLGDDTPGAISWGLSAEMAPVRVCMGSPAWCPLSPALQAAIGAILQDDPLAVHQQAMLIPLQIDMGNAHVVIVVSDWETCPVEKWGPAVQEQVWHREKIRVNVGFVQRQSAAALSSGSMPDKQKKQVLRLRVYENGAGETWACGSGACAAAVGVVLSAHGGETAQWGKAAGANPKTDVLQTQVCMRRGALMIEWAGPRLPHPSLLWMAGPTAHVFEGQVTLPLGGAGCIAF